MPLICRECGETGHRKTHCPQVRCNQCGQRGHLARDCGAAPRALQKPRRKINRCQPTGNRYPSSTYHCLPANWTLCDQYDGSLVDAIKGLKRQGLKCYKEAEDDEHFAEIEDLVHRTWDGDKVGIGVDGANLDHTGIKVVNIERIENPGKYERYSLHKQDLLETHRIHGSSAFTQMDQFCRSSGPIWTTYAIEPNGVLHEGVFPVINEHYLFHGTKAGNVKSIAMNGFNMDYSRERSLMGAGIYFAESSTKADMYADFRHKRTDGLKHMFLVRVLLGDPYVNKVKTKINFQNPPCKECQRDQCCCYNEDYYDSVIDDSHRLFRVFVAYDSDQCYPEYLITYRRVYGEEEDEEEDEFDDEEEDDEEEEYEEDADYWNKEDDFDIEADDSYQVQHGERRNLVGAVRNVSRPGLQQTNSLNTPSPTFSPGPTFPLDFPPLPASSRSLSTSSVSPAKKQATLSKPAAPQQGLSSAAKTPQYIPRAEVTVEPSVRKLPLQTENKSLFNAPKTHKNVPIAAVTALPNAWKRPLQHSLPNVAKKQENVSRMAVTGTLPLQTQQQCNSKPVSTTQQAEAGGASPAQAETKVPSASAAANPFSRCVLQ